jgi:hypothetical protein
MNMFREDLILRHGELSDIDEFMAREYIVGYMFYEVCGVWPDEKLYAHTKNRCYEMRLNRWGYFNQELIQVYTGMHAAMFDEAFIGIAVEQSDAARSYGDVETYLREYGEHNDITDDELRLIFALSLRTHESFLTVLGQEAYQELIKLCGY